MIDRSEIHKDLPSTSTNLTVDSLVSEGLGLGLDVGMILTAPVQYLPSLAVVGRDMGGTSYNMGNGILHSTGNRPGDTPQTVDAGFSISPILSNGVRMVLTADFDDALMLNIDRSVAKRLHGGIEFNFNDFFFLRGGMNQRYWTGGVELASENFQLQAASYGEDIGPANAAKEDRRWVTKFTFRF